MSALNEQEQKEVKEAYNILEEIEQSQKDENINKVFFKKYKARKLIAESSFGSVYEGIDIKTKNRVAIKLEERLKYNFLEMEAYNLFTLKGYGIIEVLSFGRNQKYNIMVQPLLGDSLYKLYLKCKKKFTLKDICLIGLQCLDRIEWIHKKNIIHRDIKPDNFLMGVKDPRIIYLIDFGLSKKYRSERTSKHIQFALTKKLTGTARYASINALKGFELSRRDDLESFCYMIIFFLIKKLPWQGAKAQTQAKRYKKIRESKEDFNINDHKDLIPTEFIKIFKYVKSLKFDEEPNYNMIRNAFNKILIDVNYKENETFSWIKDKKVLSLKKISDIHKRKGSSKKRIMDRISKLEEENKSIKKRNKNLTGFLSDQSLSVNRSINNIDNNNLKSTERLLKLDLILNQIKNNNKINNNRNNNIDNNQNIYLDKKSIFNSLNNFKKSKKEDISTSTSRKANFEYDIEDSSSKINSSTRQNNNFLKFSPKNVNKHQRTNKNSLIFSSLNYTVKNNPRNRIINKSTNNNANHIRTNNLTNSNFLTFENTDFRIAPPTNYKIYENNFIFLKVNDNKNSITNNIKTKNKYSNNILYHSKINSTPFEKIPNKYKFNNKLIKSKCLENNLYKRKYFNYNDNYY
jgi:serine/threonine protein kinase